VVIATFLMGRLAVAIDVAIRAEVMRLLASGEDSAKGAARRFGIHDTTVILWARSAGMVLQRNRAGGVAGVRPVPEVVSRRRHPMPGPDEDYVDADGHLTYAGRIVIGLRIRERRPQSQIAAELGVHPATVTREIARGSVDGSYRARFAQRRAEQARRRPKSGKIAPGSRLRAEVAARLTKRHSPEQISQRLRIDFPDQHDMQVSHETIYQALYVQGAGALRHELTVEKALRQGRMTRRPRSKLPARTNRSWIGDATFTARPAEVADRAVPGHWEGDLVIGGDLRSALVTLFERTSRFTLIGRITVHDAVTVTDRLTLMAERLPESIWRTLTWDQGVEMADHARFTIATGCPVFFCDPHSPWQRPTNENGNGLIREFFPKGTNFTQVTDAQVTEAEHLLNTRPRKILGFATPAETLNELLTVASTP